MKCFILILAIAIIFTGVNFAQIGFKDSTDIVIMKIDTTTIDFPFQIILFAWKEYKNQGRLVIKIEHVMDASRCINTDSYDEFGVIFFREPHQQWMAAFSNGFYGGCSQTIKCQNPKHYRTRKFKIRIKPTFEGFMNYLSEKEFK